MGSVVLVTGVAHDPGERAAATLAADPGVDRVIGVDVVPPRRSLAPADFVRADLRGGTLGRILDAYEVDTVVHAGVLAAPGSSGGRAAQKEINVIGTMQLLAACQRAERVRKVVVRSSTAVYGLAATNPALFREDDAPRTPPSSGYAKDVTEVEGYTRGFARRRPGVVVTVLRFAYLLGRSSESVMAHVLALPVVPTVLGFDPRLQFLAEDDAAEALRRAAVDDHPGVFNVAGRGVVTVSQAAHLAGRPTAPVPAPAAGLVARTLRRTGLVDVDPGLARAVQYAQVADTTALATAFGWTPARSTREAVLDFAAARGLAPTLPAWAVPHG